MPSAARAARRLKTTRSANVSEAKLAEREGFEPSVEFPLHTLSKRAPSTTRTSLRFRINHLRAVGNSVAQNPPSNPAAPPCDVGSVVYGRWKQIVAANCVRPPNVQRSLTAIAASTYATRASTSNVLGYAAIRARRGEMGRSAYCQSGS